MDIPSMASAMRDNILWLNRTRRNRVAEILRDWDKVGKGIITKEQEVQDILRRAQMLRVPLPGHHN